MIDYQRSVGLTTLALERIALDRLREIGEAFEESKPAVSIDEAAAAAVAYLGG